MTGFVYIWRDRARGKFYIGSHWGSPDDGYVCTGETMLPEWKRRPADFRRRIVAVVTTSRADLYAEEHRWLRMLERRQRPERYYNTIRAWQKRRKSETKSINMRVDSDLLAKVDARARRMSITRTAWLCMAVAEELERIGA